MSASETEASASSTQVTTEEPVQQVRKVWELWAEASHMVVLWQRYPSKWVGESHCASPSQAPAPLTGGRGRTGDCRDSWENRGTALFETA